MSNQHRETMHKPPRRRMGPPGGGPPGMPVEKAKDFKGSFKKLLTYIGRYKFAVLAVMVIALQYLMCWDQRSWAWQRQSLQKD